jgi:hypothetical protein
MRDFIPECARVIEKRLGAEAIEAIFVCGSFALGDETVVLETDPPVLLSDVDLVVVVKSLDALFAWRNRRSELGGACEGIGDDVCFSGRVDVGVMLAEDLAGLPPRPGVYDMRAKGRVLSGNPRILELIPDYAPAEITTGEALVLIENRMIALIDSRPRARLRAEVEPYESWYRIARVYTDIAAAAVSIAGAYVPGYAARRDLIRMKTGGADALFSGLLPTDVVGKIERWTRYKLEPSIETAGAGPGAGAFGELWEEAARDVLLFWRKAATRAREPRRDLSNPRGVEELAGKRRAHRDWRNHLRGWRAVLGELGGSRRLPCAAGLGTRLVSGSPLDAVREAGVRLLDRRLTRGADSFVAGAPGGFPYHGGSWDDAAAEITCVWNNLVFGRAGG